MPVEICRYFQGWTQGLLQKSLTNEKVVALKGDKISEDKFNFCTNFVIDILIGSNVPELG